MFISVVPERIRVVTMEDEVTRVESVHYLEGATGHAIASTLFLPFAGALILLGRWGFAALCVVVAAGVSLHGLSIYAWDAVRERIEAALSRGDSGPTRTLAPHHVSDEMKAELVAGFVLVGGLAVALTVASAVLRAIGFRVGLLTTTGTLLVGNGCGLLRSVRAP